MRKGPPSAFLATLLITTLAPARGQPEPPRLVLQLTIDQLRGDMLPRFRGQFGEGGFRWLLERGAGFANAHHDAANTMTASGHAVLVTGAATTEHGLVANDWYDRETRQNVYCVSDPRYPVLGETAKAGAGLSPTKLLSSTIGDELLASRPGRRSFAVAGKDRSAIIPGGRLGKAYWFSEKTGGFTTSLYYQKVLPPWLVVWNESKAIARYRALDWTPLRPGPAPGATGPSENLHARPAGSLGRTFPHPLLAKSEALFLSAFSYTPFLDELTLTFLRELIRAEKVGQNGELDYLAVSLSATDYIGHAYGPNSAEAADNLLRLDANLAGFFRFLDQTIGLDHILIVLSSDHGSSDIPESMSARGFNAGRIQPAHVLRQVNAALRRQFAVEADLVSAFVPPGLYLDREQVVAARLDPAVVERALAAAARALPGIAHAFERSRLLGGEMPVSPLVEKVQRGFHPARSGDVVVVQEQFWYLYPEAERYAAMHGSPYAYDTHVPVIFCGPGISPMTSFDLVTPAQIAPTLAGLLGCGIPSGARAATLLPGLSPRARR